MKRSSTLILVLTLFGCDALGEFGTDGDEIYRGQVIGATDPTSCPAGIDCSFIRRGFGSGARLELTFDPGEVYSQPGTITTTDEICGPSFDNTELVPIAPLVHDQLALYEFPGRGRVRNYIFGARPISGPLVGRDATVFLSLIRGGAVEVRIIVGAGGEICDPSDCAALATGDCSYFGLFELTLETR